MAAHIEHGAGDADTTKRWGQARLPALDARDRGCMQFAKLKTRMRRHVAYGMLGLAAALGLANVVWLTAFSSSLSSRAAPASELHGSVQASAWTRRQVCTVYCALRAWQTWLPPCLPASLPPCLPASLLHLSCSSRLPGTVWPLACRPAVSLCLRAHAHAHAFYVCRGPGLAFVHVRTATTPHARA